MIRATQLIVFLLFILRSQDLIAQIYQPYSVRADIVYYSTSKADGSDEV